MKSPKALSLTLIFLTLSVVLISSCKKDDNNSSKTGTPLIKSISYPGIAQAESYTYDSAGRLVNKISPGSSTIAYTYNGNSVIKLDQNTISGIQYITSYILGSNGYATSAVLRRDNPTAATFIQYSYDADGHLTSETLTDSASGNVIVTSAYVWNGGNMTGKTETSGITLNYAYTYFTDKVSTIENANMGLGWLGKGNVNAVKSETESGTTENYTYTVDLDTRIVTKTTDGSAPVTYTYY